MRVVSVLLLLSVCNVAFAQDLERIDSLVKVERQKKGIEKFNTLNEIAWEYRFVNQDSTIRYAQKSYQLGTKLGLKKSLAKPLNFIGVALEYKGEAIEAYDHYKQALMVASAQNDMLEVAYANNNMGRLLFDQGNIERAQEHFDQALSIFEQKLDSVGIGYVYLNLGHLYQYQKNFKKAEQYFLRVYSFRKSEALTRQISSLMQLGKFYKDFNVLAKSNSYFLKADSICAQINDEILRAEVSIQLAENRLAEKNLNQAHQYALRALRYATKQNLTRPLAGANFIMGRVFFERNDLQSAKVYFGNVVNSPKPFKDLPLKMDAHYYLGQIYSRVGQHDKELQSRNEYLVLRDSAKEADLAKQLDRLEFQYKLEIDLRRKENELLKTLEAKNTLIIKKQQTLNLIYGVALLIIIAVVIVLYRNIRLKQKHSREIEQINASLESLVEKRTRIIRDQNDVLKEYAYFNAHQIRGPLARILGLISILDLEFSRDAFGPYMNMLHKAGNDLDKAIKEINTRLNTIDEF